MEEAPTTPIPTHPVLHTPPPPPPPPAIAATPSLPPPPTPPTPAAASERDGGRRGVTAGGGGGGRLGLTKEVLSAHTQQEEQNFMCRFRDLSQLRVFDPASVLRRHTTTPVTRGSIISVHTDTYICPYNSTLVKHILNQIPQGYFYQEQECLQKIGLEAKGHLRKWLLCGSVEKSFFSILQMIAPW